MKSRGFPTLLVISRDVMLLGGSRIRIQTGMIMDLKKKKTTKEFGRSHINTV